MKNPLDPRHMKRQKLVEELFKYQFHAQEVTEEARKIIDQEMKLDELIAKAAPEFPIDKINRVDLAILRLAVYELIFTKDAPQKVILDEAIELAKEYGGETSPAFVNGALGNIVKHTQN